MAKTPSKDDDRKRRTKSVYPDARTEQILVGTTQSYNLALHIFAGILCAATGENEKLFRPEEWELMAKGERLSDFFACLAPAHALASVLRKQSLVCEYTDATCAKLYKMSPLNAWAVLWACRFHDANPQVPEWWTLSARVKSK